jgi:hypothetical protein
MRLMKAGETGAARLLVGEKKSCLKLEIDHDTSEPQLNDSQSTINYAGRFSSPISLCKHLLGG